MCFLGARSVLAVWLVALFSVLPATVTADEVSIEKLIQFNVPEQRIDLALTQFAEQANITLLFPTDGMDDVVSNELVGTYPVSQGADILLAGTGLKPTFKNKLVLNIVSDPKENDGDTEMNNRKSARTGLLAAFLSFFTAGGAVAQDQSAGVQNDEDVIEEIVVTATRRETTLQDAALSVTALTTEDLYRQGIEQYEDFARQVPGLTMTGAGSFAKFNIRGTETTSTTSGIGNQRSTAVYLDEQPLMSSRITTPNVRLYDVERLEVLRGPQGTSFGAGSLSGAIRIITNKADPSGFDASIRSDIGTIEDGGMRKKVNAMINVPLADNLAMRVVGYWVDEEGYIDNLGSFGLPPIDDENDQREWGGRVSFNWSPAPQFTATFTYSHDEAEAHPLVPLQITAGSKERATFNREFAEVENNSYSLVLEYDFDWATLISATTYAEVDSDWDLDASGFVGGALPFGFGNNAEQELKVQEIRLTSNTTGQFDWLVGLYYLDRRDDSFGEGYMPTSFTDLLGIDASGVTTFRGYGTPTSGFHRIIENSEYAAFGELTWHFTDKLSGTFGLRYSEFDISDAQEEGSYVTNLFPLIFSGGGGVLAAFPDTRSVEIEDVDETTMKFVLNYQRNDDQTFYLSAAEGFRRPHPNSNFDSPQQFPPFGPIDIPRFAESDSLWSYEIGAKMHWLDSRLRTNLALYFIEWDDVQLSASLPGAIYATNGGDVESKGFEAEVLYYPAQGWELGLNLTLANSEVVSISDADSFTSGMAEGADLVTPEKKISGFAQYSWALNNSAAEMFARIDFQYVDETPNGPPNIGGVAPATPNPAFDNTDAYTNTNVQLGWQNNRFSVIVYGENISDNDDAIYVSPDAFGGGRYITLRPRTFGLRLNWRY